MTSLTARQSDTLAFISSFQAEKGFGPSIREIGVGVGLTSPSSVHRLVLGLEERGAIRRLSDRARTIEVVGDQGAEFHLKAILTELGKVGILMQSDKSVVSAMRFLGRRDA